MMWTREKSLAPVRNQTDSLAIQPVARHYINRALSFAFTSQYNLKSIFIPCQCLGLYSIE
jgi:hypothetical protein